MLGEFESNKIGEGRTGRDVEGRRREFIGGGWAGLAVVVEEGGVVSEKGGRMLVKEEIGGIEEDCCGWELV